MAWYDEGKRGSEGWKNLEGPKIVWDGFLYRNWSYILVAVLILGAIILAGTVGDGSGIQY